jgi:hypothetical protein
VNNVRIFLNCLFLLIIFGGNLFGAFGTKEDSIVFGLMGGKTDIQGFYKDQLSNGYNFGIFINYSFFKNRYLLFESDLTYTELSLKESTLSKLSFYSFGVGPVMYIPAWSHFKPYAGISANLNYFELTAVETHKKERTVKIGAAAKAGFYIPVFNNFSTNFGIKYSINELSGKTFQNITYSAGVSYSYNFITKEKAESNFKQIEIDEYYESGLKHFKIGDGAKAKEYFKKVISYDNHYKDVENYLKTITINEENYDKAEKLISENKPFEALPLLVDAEKYLIRAFEKLREIRQLLFKEENDLVKNGIDAYNKEDYERCIYYMKRVQLINPGNESVNLYLPRAIKRYDALKKIE